MEDDAQRPDLDGDYLDVALRAWAIPADEPDDELPTAPAARRVARVPDQFLVFDTETTVDASQRLVFGSFRYLRRDPEADDFRLVCVEEGLVVPDDLADWNAAAARTIEDYVAANPQADVDPGTPDAARVLRARDLSWFLKGRLWRATRGRMGVVCFNLPFDISRLAWHAGETRNRHPETPDPFEGGFSFALWGPDRDGKRVESRHRPRIAIKQIDSKRALKGLRSPEKIDEIDLIPEGADTPEPDPDWRFRGHFLDLRTLVFALTDRGHTLESACGAFGVPYTKQDVKHGTVTTEYIQYCREDTAATARLLEASVREFLKHPIDLQATRAYSPATLGKHYLRAMGVSPIRERQRVDPETLGWSMSAYYGGRAECRIRHTPVPVAYCDFLSMYPTVCGLMELWNLLTAAHVNIEQSMGEDITAMLHAFTADQALDPTRWPQLVGIAQIEPDADVLPVRARYGAGPSWQIGVNPLTSRQPMWFTLADLAASKLLTGKTPKILRAIRFTSSDDQLAGLRPVDLLGDTPVDPRTQDFFRAAVEERRKVEARTDLPDQERAWRSKGLKVLANATSYGIYAQMTRHELGDGRRQATRIYGARDEPWDQKVPAPEEPGDYCFPPLAAAITGGARLMLATLEHLVTQAGGTYAFCDTDSMAIVATQTGGLIPCPGGTHRTSAGDEAIRALSWEESDEIRDRFETLKPYDPTIVTDNLLELEDENYADPKTKQGRRELWCYAISAKRYVLYQHSDAAEPALIGWCEIDSADDVAGAATAPEQLLKPSEHGLGHLLNPTDPESADRSWIAHTWQYLLRLHHDPNAPPPDWADRPAVGRNSVSSPALRSLFATLNRDRPYDERIKPFNFLNVAFVPAPERPADDERMVLIAPYEPNAQRWLQQPWTNRYSGRTYRLSAEPSRGRVREGVVTPKSYATVLGEYRANPETKSLGPAGVSCAALTAGVLQRRPVRLAALTHVGKESNRLEDLQNGLIEDPTEVANDYDDFYTAVFKPLVVPLLSALGVRETGRRTGQSIGAVSAVLRGRARPRSASVAAYLEVAVRHAEAVLLDHGLPVPSEAVACLASAVTVGSAIPCTDLCDPHAPVVVLPPQTTLPRNAFPERVHSPRTPAQADDV